MKRAWEFKRVLAAEVVSNFGSMLSHLALAWIAALALQATPFQMGLLLVADVIAGAVASLALGVAIDRLEKRAVMVVSDVGRAAVLGGVAWLAASGQLAFWMLVASAAALGLLGVAFQLARSAWIAQSSDEADLPSRNAQLSVGASLSETLAFALGGWLYQGLGAIWALLIDAASYVFSAACLRGVRPVPVERTAPASGWLRAAIDDARDGISTIASIGALRALAVIEILVALGFSMTATSYMVFVTRDLGLEPSIIGMVAAAGGIGSLLGAALAISSGRRLGEGGAMALGLLLLSVGTACIPLAPGPTVIGVALLVAHQVIGDGGHTSFGVHDRTLRQIASPPEQLARVDAGIGTLGRFATLAGALGGGALATEVGTRPVLYFAALLYLAAAAWALWMRRSFSATAW